MIGVKMIGWKQNRVFLFENDRSFWWQVTVLKNPGNQQKPRQSTYLDEYMLFKKTRIKKFEIVAKILCLENYRFH